jgi:hypothetical protein
MSLTIENICIRGDKTNGKRIIQFFERLGGNNRIEQYDGAGDGYYLMDSNNQIKHRGYIPQGFTLITLSDTLLPSEWCVFDENDKLIKWSSPHLKNVKESLHLTPSQFKALTEDQREIEFEWTDELVREVLNSVYYPKMELKEKDWVEHINKFKASKREEKIKPKCGICGGEQVEIRGRYPGHDKRYTCPTCTQERLDQISEISAKGYGRVAQSKQ